MTGTFYEGRWYEDSGMVCFRCGRPLYKSDISGYSYQCFHCDEDFYSIEALKPDGRYTPPVMVARPVDGITINEALEYILTDDGQPRIFYSQAEAEAFLSEHGFAEEDLAHLYFEQMDLVVVGSYAPEHIEREGYGQGCIVKDEVAYLSYPDKVCYVAELDDAAYTHNDLLDLCDNQEKLARVCFDCIDWQHPESWIEEQFVCGEWTECPVCGRWYDVEDERVCPHCGGAKVEE